VPSFMPWSQEATQSLQALQMHEVPGSPCGWTWWSGGLDLVPAVDHDCIWPGEHDTKDTHGFSLCSQWVPLLRLVILARA
jgi:hypothetical protein